MTLQVAVRLEQRLGPQMQKPGEQPWQGEKKQLTKKQQQQSAAEEQPGAARKTTSPLPQCTHTHTPLLRSGQQKNGEVPKNKRDSLPPTQMIKKKMVAVNYFFLLTNGMGS
ncbi:hypothetical protein WISP_04485 [Willisornis vidua]|uniref:Uncharacterized protein n=1 Tax=Willisornis vidua TaxID=1566151 RepID=A0ABQ9DTB8_9PASS|nr:hypothetical protein WISP_04485 [Willisornis vidua]